LEIGSSPSVIITALGALVGQFNSWLAEEKAAMDWVRKDVLTKKIADANHRMDLALTALKAQVHAQELRVVQSMAEAAHRIYVMLSGYGNVNAKPYEEQDGDVRSIIGQLTGSGAYVADASILNIYEWITELQTAFTVFEQLLTQRDAKTVLKPAKTFKEVRKGIEKVYHQIESVINAGALMNLSPTYTTFINHLNPEIERLNGEFHRVRYDIAHAQPEEIEPQIYTGKPLTPSTFKTLYVTPHNGTIQLELGKDYDLSFKNNVEVGVAECTIHGKGTYKGSKTVTFVIIRAM
jgi:hypothetical protein